MGAALVPDWRHRHASERKSSGQTGTHTGTQYTMHSAFPFSHPIVCRLSKAKPPDRGASVHEVAPETWVSSQPCQPLKHTDDRRAPNAVHM